MCSICGFSDEEPHSVEETLSMLIKTRHRGPDSAGIYLDGKVWKSNVLGKLEAIIKGSGKISLGHLRLEIVGGEKGVQPISSCDGKLALVCNGEIYNYNRLRPLLGEHRFSSGSDNEVLVHLIEDFYEGSLRDAVISSMPLLDGMYAFAVTDGESLVVARDPVGKKPIYFTDTPPFYFASERKALDIEDGSIRRLPPGKVLEVKGKEINIYQGYEIEKPQIHIDDMKEALGEYERVFDKAIEKRTLGLDKVGTLFSGGIDSVLVSKALQDQGLKVTCYSVGTKDSSDLEMAEEAAKKLNLDIKVEYLTEGLIEELLPEVIEAIELNGLTQVEAAIPMYIAARMCSEDGNHKVMFTGQGADELFAGYTWYGDVIREKGYFALHERMWDDISKLYIDTLEREDRMAMAHSIELRAPFLDRDLIRTAMKISPFLKIKDADDPYRKLVHRELAVHKGIPKYIAYREKSRVQDGAGIHSIIQSIADRYFEGRRIPEVDILDYGSNYRYNEDYTTPEILALLDEVTRSHEINLIDCVEE